MCLFFHDVLHLKNKDHVKQLELRFTTLKGGTLQLTKERNNTEFSLRHSFIVLGQRWKIPTWVTIGYQLP